MTDGSEHMASPSGQSGPMDDLRIRLKHLQNDYALLRREYETAARGYLEVYAHANHDNREIKAFNLRLRQQVHERTKMLGAANDALRENEHRFRMLLHNVPYMAVQGYAADGTVRYWNPASEKLYGYSAREAVGRNLLDLIIPPEMRDYVQQAIRQMLDSGAGIPSAEFMLMRKDGSRVPVFSSHVVVRSSPDDVLLYCIDFDLSERKAAEEQLRRAKEAAEAANRAKDSFLANMSHEIRTPMNAVIGFTDLLCQTAITPQQEQYLQIIKSRGRDLLRLLDDILDISRIEADQLELVRTPFSPAEFVGDLAAMMDLPAREKCLRLRTEIAPDLPDTIYGDERRLRQIMVNLVGNAVKFTERGEVLIRVTAGQCGACAGQAAAADDDAGRARADVWLHFEVHDTGVGIPPDMKDAIFDLFTQADGSTVRRFGGVGLGLTIVKRLAQMLGGKVWVESPAPAGQSGAPAGMGSVFHFAARFNVVRTKPQDAAPRVAAPAGRSTGGLRVLLAEDDAMSCILLEHILREQGHKVSSVASGAAALAALQQSAFDLILMDVRMPDMNGLEVTRRIRKLDPSDWPSAGRGPSPAAIPIIAITAEAMRGDREKCLSAGMNDYIGKPVHPDRITELLKKWGPAKSA